MTMQITAPQAQKRCCFIEISSYTETSSSLCVFEWYSRHPAWLHFQIGQIISYLDIFTILTRYQPILLPESSDKLADTAVTYRFGHAFQT